MEKSAATAQVTLDKGSQLKSAFAGIVILATLVVGYLIYSFILGSPGNFEDNDPANHPLPGNYLGIIYKGGAIIPLAIALFLMLIVFSIERVLTLSKATGKGSVDVFVKKIQIHLNQGDVNGARKLCDEQKGSVANVVNAALHKYDQMSKDTGLDREQKMMAIQKEVEEATVLEMPMMQKNLVIIATIVSIGTLIGLIGTVIGMIKAFSALATAGTPDAVQLANGISEALVNTALGITTSTIATIMYNYFTNRIDSLTYAIDEAGFSIVQTFGSRN